MTRPRIGLASLRMGDPAHVAAIAAGAGFPLDEMAHLCTLCGCAMSGSAVKPNRVAEWCQNQDCWCHDAGAVEAWGVL